MTRFRARTVSITSSALAFTALLASLSVAEAGGKLGVILQTYNGNQGARVVRAYPGTASHRMICPHCNKHHYLGRANVIVGINGQTVRTRDDAVRLLQSSPLTASIDVLNLNKGTTKTYRTELTPFTAKPQNRPVDDYQIGEAWDWLNSIGIDGGGGGYGGGGYGGGFDGAAANRRNMQNSFNRNYSKNPDHAR